MVTSRSNSGIINLVRGVRQPALVKMNNYNTIYSKIQYAREVLKDIKHVTRLDSSSTFSRITGGNVFLKLENLQKTGSFKVRGAAYAMSQLTDKEKKSGVIAASAGNHAQGVAYAATRLGIKSTIVMPIFSPVAKNTSYSRIRSQRNSPWDRI